MKNNRRWFSLFVILSLVLQCFMPMPFDKKAEAVEFGNLSCAALSGCNIGANDYEMLGAPVYSYLIPTDYGFARVQGNAVEGAISVSRYDPEYRLLERRVINSELPVFGGFFATDSAYYTVTGQENFEENNNCEVIRISKFDTNWNRIGTCGLYGANTTRAFHAGSCRMDMEGKYLIIRTCHEMYYISDGYRHQANVTIEVDTSNMTVTDYLTKITNNSAGYVSHSFNQFVKIENHSIVSLDHGDAIPRSFCVMKYPTDISDGKFQGKVKRIDAMTFPGGSNATGASAGGFEISDSKYLIAGNSVIQDENNLNRKTRNIFVIAVDKNLDSAETKWITNYDEGEISASTPHLVKLSGDRFMLLWYRDTYIYYVLIDGEGNVVSDTFRVSGELSDCAPIYYNGKVIWYTWNNGIEDFYEISPSDLYDFNVKEYSYEHDYERISIEKGYITLRCKKCGYEISGYIVTGFSVFWLIKGSGGYYTTNVPSNIQKENTILFDFGIYSDYSKDSPEFSKLTIVSLDPDKCIVDEVHSQVTFREGGIYKIRVYPEYYPEAYREYKFVVNPLPVVTPTITPTPTIPVTPTITPTPTIPVTPTITPTPTMPVTPTITPTLTVIPTVTPSEIPNETDITPTATVTPSVTVTPTEILTPSPTRDPSGLLTEIPDPTASAAPTPQVPDNPSGSPEPTDTPVPPDTPSPSAVPTPTDSPDPGPDETVSPTPSKAADPTPVITTAPAPTHDPEIKSTRQRVHTVDGKTVIEWSTTNIYDQDEDRVYSEVKDNKVKIDRFSTYKTKISITGSIVVFKKKYYVTHIGEKFLADSDSVKKVKLSSRTKVIEENAFKGKKNLKKIEIKVARLKNVGTGAFSGIYKKAKIVLTGTLEKCEKAKELIVASGIGKKVKIIINEV